MSGLAPGFAEPVGDAQRCFRQLLDAMARPGRVAQLQEIAAPPGLSPAAAALALTLVDFETPAWLGPGTDGAAEWLRFHCGAPLASEPCRAAFACAADASRLPPLGAFELGSAEYPDRSTTLVLEVAALGSGEPLVLRGPGIDGSTTLAVDGFPAALRRERAELAVLFPSGLDLILTCGARLAALPRTTVVED